MSQRRAAGGVVWRSDVPRRVAVVHRPRYDDWSLPKGGVHPKHETDLGAAVREVAEETGLRVQVQRRLEPVRYTVGGETKSVAYWTMRALGGDFVANDETDRLEWWTPDEAAERLTYQSDREVVASASSCGEHDAVVVLVRHARAGKRSQWPGEDRLRPLDREGRRQARGLVGFADAFGVTALAAADLVRCEQTVQPVADATGRAVASWPPLSDRAATAEPHTAVETVRTAARPETVTMVCSQGDAIPTVLDGLGVDPPHPCRKGSAWVLFLRAGSVVGADYYPRPAGRLTDRSTALPG